MIASLFVHTDRVIEKNYGCFFSHGLESTECYRALFSNIKVNTWEEVSSMALSWAWLKDVSDSVGFWEKFQSWINLYFFNLHSHDPWFCNPVKFLQSSKCYSDGGGLDWVRLQKTKKNVSFFFLSAWYNFICLFSWTAIIILCHIVTSGL